jgi:hypothetical protein
MGSPVPKTKAVEGAQEQIVGLRLIPVLSTKIAVLAAHFPVCCRKVPDPFLGNYVKRSRVTGGYRLSLGAEGSVSGRFSLLLASFCGDPFAQDCQHSQLLSH